jgi:serine/threonine protein kinase
MTDRRDAGSTTGAPAGETTPLRYEFRGHLGSGGMADVYRARDTELGRDVAVKVFRDDEGTVADVQRREREIHLLGAMSHPGLVGIHDAGTLEIGGRSRRYLVMELLEGRSLAHRVARGPLTTRQTAEVAAQLGDALSYVHARGIVHRDIKPENILLDEVPAFGYTIMAKLADFGVAQFDGGARVTNDGAVMGTAAYISPEQVRGEAVGAPSDIYSLGLVLLEALTGEREYDGTPVEAALARLQRPPRIPDELSSEWRTFLAAMTAVRPEERPTAHDVAATMRDILRPMAAGHARHGEHSRAADAAASVALPKARAALAKLFTGRGGGPVVAAAVLIATTVAGVRIL